MNLNEESKLFLCVDAGGTKTRAFECLATQRTDGEVDIVELSDNSFGPGNYFTNGSEVTSKRVAEISQGLVGKFKDAESIDRKNYNVFAGFAGVRGQERKSDVQNKFIAEGFSEEKIVIDSDSDLILRALNREAILAIAGTGSIVVANLTDSESTTKRADGAGWETGQEFSGHRLGIEATEIARDMNLGNCEKTELYSVVQNFYKQEITNKLYMSMNVREKVSYVAELAPKIFELAHEGEEHSQRIIAKAVENAKEQIVSVYEMLEEKIPKVAFWGGMAKAELPQKLFLDPLRASLKANSIDLSVEVITFDPVIEAIKYEVKRRSIA